MAQHLDLEEELKNDDFRVTIFGSARSKPEDKIYKGVYQLAKKIAEAKMDLVTGGGPGLMEAAAMGHSEGDVEGNIDSIGLNIILPFEQGVNPGIDLYDEHEKFSTRLDEFMMLSHVVVVTPGGIGTCLELFYTWQLAQVKHICHTPIIMVGEMWYGLIDWIEKELLEGGFISAGDLDTIIIVEEAEEAFEIIEAVKEHRDALGDKACFNCSKYGTKFRKR
jgi:uncharacterized protein (TIGR00730 family)